VVLNVLLISPFPPARDGLANYAVQFAADLRHDGHRVDVLSPEPSAAVYHAPLKKFSGLARAARLGRRSDRVIVQFHPEIFFWGMEPRRFVRGWLGLLAFFRYCGTKVEVVIHETPYDLGGRTAPIRRRMWKALWRQAGRVVVHTEKERSVMRSTFGVDDTRLSVRPHGASFRHRCRLSREEARASLDLEAATFVFLCAGFLQPHKGFDRAAAALGRLHGPHLSLHIVGEMRVRTREHERYVRLLRSQSRSDPRVVVHEGYVSDEEFDRWLVASDAVVLPYREIWSSGVVERAALYGRPVIVTDVGGLPDQIAESGLVVRDADELVAAMASVSGAEIWPRRPPPAHASPAEQAEAQVRERAEELRLWTQPLGEATRPVLDMPDIDALTADLQLPAVPEGPGLKKYALRVVRRLTAWQLYPIVGYVNALRAEVLNHGLDGEPGQVEC
jgi:glycosyltransferase involved in cell wall biosynthesis